MTDSDARSLVGRRAALEPLRPSAYDFVYAIVCDANVGARSRYRGLVPSYDQMVSQLWDGVLAQYLVVDRTSQKMAGVVNLYRYNPRASNCFAAALTHPSFLGSGVVIEGLLLLLDHAFDLWSLKKVFFEVMGFNLDQMATITRFTEEEARLRDFDFAYGQLWDSVTLSVDAERWQTVRAQLLGRSDPTDGLLADP